MKFEGNIAKKKQWVFDDSMHPFQLRIMSSDEIQSVQHLHKTMHEYFYVIKGSLSLSVDGKIFRMEKDDLISVDPGERHIIIEKSDDLILMLIMPPSVPDDKVVIA